MEFSQFLHQNQFIFREGKTIGFKSYNSVVCIVDIETDKITLGRDWDYSQTTLRHLYQFLHRFTNVYVGNEKNKKAYIQKLINKGKINYNISL